MDVQNQKPQESERLKEIPKWTRRYAQNRTLTIFVLMVIAPLIGMGFAAFLVFPFVLAVTAFMKGKMILGWVGIAGLVAILIVWIISISKFISKFGGKNKGLLDQIIDRWIYGDEGTVLMPQPELTKKKKWLEIATAIVWLILFIGTMELGMLNFIPVKYVLPVSALYCVPSEVFAWYFWRSPRMGPIYLLSPILYAIHAILIITGVPIFFTGQFGVIFNLCLPLTGYSFLAVIIGHLYGRYALKKLKGIAHLEGDAANGD